MSEIEELVIQQIRDRRDAGRADVMATAECWRNLTLVTGRKPHMCLWCGTRIATGERHVVESVVDGNRHWRNRFHLECREAIGLADDDEIDWWNDEGCIPKYHRGTTELATQR